MMWSRSTAAGLTHRPSYAMRHTYAAFSIAAEVSLFTLARRMGTSDGADRQDLRPPAAGRGRARARTVGAFDSNDAAEAAEGQM
jgi:hypothetical protein